jgi:hypothetical protein
MLLSSNKDAGFTLAQTEKTNAELNAELDATLINGVALFVYLNKEGEERLAVGTTNPDFFAFREQALTEKAATQLLNLKNLYADLKAEYLFSPNGKEAKELVMQVELALSALEAAVTPKKREAGERKPSEYKLYFDLQAAGFRQYLPSNLLAVLKK